MNPKSAKLSCHTGALAGTEIKINRDILIGRQPSCDLVLYPHSVSGQHARLFFNTDDGHYYIEDLGSSNGTWVDRIRVNQPIKLDALSVITFAKDIDFIFHRLDPASTSDSQSYVDATVFQAPRTVQSPQQATEYQQSFTPPPSSIKTKGAPKERQSTEFMESFSVPPSFEEQKKPKAPKQAKTPKQPKTPGQPKTPEQPKASKKDSNTLYQKSFSPPPSLKQSGEDKTTYNKSFDPPPSFAKPKKKLTLVVNTKGEKAQFSLRPGKNTIGRSSSADITISDPFISSSHAVIDVKSDGRIVLEDMNSSNKTYVNGQSIIKPVVVKKDMQIRFGPNSEASIIQ